MFAPDQEKVASELVRVCRPEGRICMANWSPGSFAGELGSLFGSYSPKVPGLLPPTLWGTEDRLQRASRRVDPEHKNHPTHLRFSLPFRGELPGHPAGVSRADPRDFPLPKPEGAEKFDAGRGGSRRALQPFGRRNHDRTERLPGGRGGTALVWENDPKPPGEGKSRKLCRVYRMER